MSSHVPLVKQAGLQRARRLVSKALKSPKAVPAAEKAVGKLNRRVERFGLKRFGVSNEGTTKAYLSRAEKGPAMALSKSKPKGRRYTGLGARVNKANEGPHVIHASPRLKR